MVRLRGAARYTRRWHEPSRKGTWVNLIVIDEEVILSRRQIAGAAKRPAILMIVLATWLLGSATIQAQVPADQLARPPADAQAFTILSTAGTHGNSTIWTAGDGSHMSRESILLRGQVWEVDQSVKLGRDGMPSTWVVRGVTPQGDADFGEQTAHRVWQLGKGGTVDEIVKPFNSV